MNITEPVNPAFPEVYLLSLDDDVIGGEEGTSNRQAKQLVERTAFIKKANEAEAASRENADNNLQTQVTENKQKIDSMKGRGGYLTAHDFGVDIPAQEDLTIYALSEIENEDPVAVWNGTHVKNLFNDHVWVLTNTPDTDPAIYEWTDDGLDSVRAFSNDFAGVIKGMADPGDGSKDSFVTALPDGTARILGSPASLEFLFPVGIEYIQRFNSPSPIDRKLPGTWEKWSDRADGYGLVSAKLPNYSTYTKTGNYAAGTYAMYHLAGDDYAIFKAKENISNAPEQLDLVKWDKMAPGIIVERRDLQGWTDDDFTIGHQIQGQLYKDWYVCEIIVPGGKFPSVEGGNRPT